MSRNDTSSQSFPPVTRRAWLDKIRDDLRGKSPEEVAWEYAPGLKVSPFAHHDDIHDFVSAPPFSGQWQICEQFEVGNYTATNKDILAALAGGCEALILQFSTLPDWEVLLRDVHPGLIHSTLVPRNGLNPHEVLTDFRKYITGRHLDPPANWTVRTGIPGPSFGLASIHLKATDDPVADLVQALYAATEVESGRLQFICNVGTAYFVEIARLRALRILHYNLQLARGNDTLVDASIEARCAVQTPEDYPYDAMIEYGIAALAAICGGADRLVIMPPAPFDQSAAQRRIARNVHHMLRYECKIEEIKDPVQGAYFIEGLTRDMTVRAWDMLIEHLKKDGR